MRTGYPHRQRWRWPPSLVLLMVLSAAFYVRALYELVLWLVSR
jgi:hypothetical protein